MDNLEELIHNDLKKFLVDIEWLRIVAMIAVVFIHVDAWYTPFILPATRFAVPFFFMVTGFFMGNQSKKKWKKYILRALWVLMGATLFYGLIEVAGSIYNHTSLLKWDWGTIMLKWLLFNVNPFHYHLWFLGAYLYVLCIAAMIDRFNLWRICYWLIIPLMVARFGLQYMDYPVYLSRNFLMIGLPCFLAGSWLKQHSIGQNLYISQYALCLVVLLFSCLPFLEDFILSNYLGISNGDFCSSYILAALLLVLAMKLPDFAPQYLPANTRNIVLGIYIIHPFVHFLFQHVPFVNVWISADSWSAPIIVFTTSWILCAFFFNFLLNTIKFNKG